MGKSGGSFLIVSIFMVIFSPPMSLFAKGGQDTTLTIYVVRHGQTIFNLMDRVQGISDGVLTANGITGAVNMGKGLRDIRFDAIYSSDLGRARETARLAMEQNLATKKWAVKEMPELREVSFGIFEGDPNPEMYAAFVKDIGVEASGNMGALFGAMAAKYGSIQKFLEALADFNKRIDTEYRIAEDAGEVYTRLQKAMDTIIAENPKGGNIMLVAHGQSIGFLLSLVKVEMSGQLGNSSVTKIKYDYPTGSFTLEGPIGDMSYAEAGAKM